MRFEGRICSWNADRAFGFIEPSQGGQEIFVHIRAIPTVLRPPQVGQPLSFEIELNRDGKKRAANVGVLVARRSSGPGAHRFVHRWSSASMLALPLFAVVFALVAVAWRVSPWVVAGYVVLSVVCVAAYASDKSAAVQGRRRSPESTLLLLGLAGGWPGALIAQQVLRHKTRKASFRASFWATVVLNVAGFVVLHSPLGAGLRA